MNCKKCNGRENKEKIETILPKNELLSYRDDVSRIMKEDDEKIRQFVYLITGIMAVVTILAGVLLMGGR